MRLVTVLSTISTEPERMAIKVLHKDQSITNLDLDSFNEVNADIRNTERLLDANLKIKRENDVNRKNLYNLLIDLHQKRRNIIMGKVQSP